MALLQEAHCYMGSFCVTNPILNVPTEFGSSYLTSINAVLWLLGDHGVEFACGGPVGIKRPRARTCRHPFHYSELPLGASQ